jgi:hypothetical protein
LIVDRPSTATDARRARLRDAELDLQASDLRLRVNRVRRLRRAESTVYEELCTRLGGPILRSPVR